MLTMLSERQMSPPRRSTWLPSSLLTQAQGALATGQAASQHASPDTFPVASPCTNVAFSSSLCLTRSSLKAIAALFPDAVVTTLPNSADANSMFGGLTLIPEVPGTLEIAYRIKKNVKVSGSTSILAKWYWLSVGACVLILHLMVPVLFHARCPVVTCWFIMHVWGSGRMGDQAGKWEDATKIALVTILQPNFWLFLKDKWQGQLVSWWHSFRMMSSKGSPQGE